MTSETRIICNSFRLVRPQSSSSITLPPSLPPSPLCPRLSGSHGKQHGKVSQPSYWLRSQKPHHIKQGYLIQKPHTAGKTSWISAHVRIAFLRTARLERFVNERTLGREF